VNGKLTLDDIADLRTYERDRGQFLARVIELKKRRRVAVGPIVTIVFENRDTMRFQIQEMARAERMLRDEQIEAELRTYNALIPGPGELSATLLLELTDKTALREWLPKLVGIEQSLELLIGADDIEVVRASVEADHEARLTREDVTASVHYVQFDLHAGQVERFAAEPVILVVNHPGYTASARLSEDTKASLLEDLTGT
jgi:hypothetical protein